MSTFDSYKSNQKILRNSNTSLKDMKSIIKVVGIENGSVYTPEVLSDYVAEKLIFYALNDKEFISKKRILVVDPACGTGALLGSTIQSMENQGKLDLDILGVDMDKKAIQKCRENQQLANNKSIRSRFICTNSLIPLGNKRLLEGWKGLLQMTGFGRNIDLLIANPPWGADISSYHHKLNRSDFSTLNGQIDSYQLFLELSLKIVNKGGYFAFIVPDSIMNHGRSSIRDLLLAHTQIRFLARLGEKMFPGINRGCALIICKNEPPSKSNHVDCFRLSPRQRRQILSGELEFDQAEKESFHVVSQSRFENNPYKQFDVDVRNDELALLKRMRRSKETLGDFLIASRGVELGSHGMILQCKYCHEWMPLSSKTEVKCSNCGKLISPSQSRIISITFGHPLKGTLPLITGKSLRRYSIYDKTWVKSGVKGINYKHESLYLPPKILIRKTGVGITAALDYSRSLTNQVVFILKPKRSEVPPLEFFIALINSRVYYFYLAKLFGEIEWRSHPYLTQSQILSLPVPSISSEQELKIIKEIVRRVGSILRKGEFRKSVDVYVESLIGKLFKLGVRDYEIILNSIDDSEQLIPVKDLKQIDRQILLDKVGSFSGL